MALPFLLDKEKKKDESIDESLDKIGESLSEANEDVKADRSDDMQPQKIAAAIEKSNDVLTKILDTLLESLALQREQLEESRGELLEKFRSPFQVDKDKTVGAKIADAQKEKEKEDEGLGLSGITKALLGGGGLLAGITGYQGFRDADKIFQNPDFIQKISSALGNIVETVTFGAFENAKIAPAIDSFIKNVIAKFNEGIKFLEDILGIKLKGEESIFAKIGKSISEGYKSFLNSEVFKSLKGMFGAVLDLDSEKFTAEFSKLTTALNNTFDNVTKLIKESVQTFTNKLIEQLLGITLPDSVPFFGGRSISSLLGKGAVTEQEIKEELIEKDRQELRKQINELDEKDSYFSSEGREAMREKERKKIELSDTYKDNYIPKAIKEKRDPEGLLGTGVLPLRIPDIDTEKKNNGQMIDQLRNEGTGDQSRNNLNINNVTNIAGGGASKGSPLISLTRPYDGSMMAHISTEYNTYSGFVKFVG